MASKKVAKKTVPKREGEVSIDKSPKVYQREKVTKEFVIKERDDLTDVQKQILEAAMDKNVKCIILDGVAGAGKTFCATLSSLLLLKAKKVGQIAYIRSAIQSVDGALGYLPGELSEKMQFFNEPFFIMLSEMLNRADVDYLVRDERLLTYPTSMLRSYNFHNSAIICDEAQNMTFDSLFTVATRAGMYSKLFIVGDSLNQNDLGKKSGFQKFSQIFSDEESVENGVRYFKLDSECIVRSPFVKFVVQKIERFNSRTLEGDWIPSKGLDTRKS